MADAENLLLTAKLTLAEIALLVRKLEGVAATITEAMGTDLEEITVACPKCSAKLTRSTGGGKL
ncbi:unnamed protein product, partial [marine sediment metagenome]